MRTGDTQSLLAAIWRGILSIVFPRHCANCAAPLEPDCEAQLCRKCWDELPRIRQPFCPKCGRPVASKAFIPFDIPCGECRLVQGHYGICRSAGVYEGSLKQCIHLFKYGGRQELARMLGRFMDECAAPGLSGEAYDAIVPVPLHRVKLRERGFNQALMLAREFGTRRGMKVGRGVLVRVRATPSQSTLSRHERLKNVRGAFAVGEGVNLRGSRFLLIDDVYTTGATADECARVLLAGGAQSVDIYTLARTV